MLEAIPGLELEMALQSNHPMSRVKERELVAYLVAHPTIRLQRILDRA